MKRGFLLLIAVILTLALCPLNGQAKLTEREEFIVKRLTNDFLKTHDVTVTGNELILIKELAPFNKNILTTEKESLSNIFLDIHNQQIIGDFAPLFYLSEKDKKGYVMEKKLSGINKLYVLTFEDTTQTWKVVNQIGKIGKDLIDLGLLKGAK